MTPPDSDALKRMRRDTALIDKFTTAAPPEPDTGPDPDFDAAPEVSLPLSLAQRILAALAFDVSHEALAAELRAVIGK